MASQQLDVYLDIERQPILVGHAWFSQRRSGPTSTVFAYTSDYLARRGALAIGTGPELPNPPTTSGDRST